MSLLLVFNSMPAAAADTDGSSEVRTQDADALGEMERVRSVDVLDKETEDQAEDRAPESENTDGKKADSTDRIPSDGADGTDAVLPRQDRAEEASDGTNLHV